MPHVTLFDNGNHHNVLLEDLDAGMAVQANQHVIVHGHAGAILDPGGHKVYNRVLSATLGLLKGGELRYLVLSHQDPDIVAAANGWLMTTDADAYCPSLWTRFVPHFGLDRLVERRLHGVPDEGQVLDLGGSPLMLLPAHFLHSPGNLQVYDPVSKILYSGDLGASLGMTYREVTDFDAHVQYMEGFHRRYIASNKAMRLWAAMVRKLDVETIAPQHGAVMRGKPLVERFVAWCEGLECGLDLMKELRAPAR
ncbi:MAG: MBL fold metallo-hydrolase [Anaeromyxobacter sp.]